MYSTSRARRGPHQNDPVVMSVGYSIPPAAEAPGGGITTVSTG